jgi:spore coat polysaccharide biosynthesis protein SpsF
MSASGAKPKMLLYCATGRGLGLGHLFRCRMLLAELAGHGSVIAAKPDPDAVRLLDSPPVPWKAVEPDLTGGSLGQRLAEIAGDAGASIVLLDCKDTSRELVLSLRQRGLDVVTLEDLGPGRLEADLLLDPHLQPGSPEAAYSGRAECCFGPGWALLDPAFGFRRGMAKHKTPANSPLTVVVSLGGSDPAELTGRVIGALEAVEHKLNIEVVIGPAADSGELPPVGKHPLRVHRGLPGLAELLGCADIAFTGGGITMFESLSLGAATVVVPQHAEQHRNACRLEERGAVLLAPTPDVAGAGAALREISEEICLDQELRTRLANVGKLLVDGGAVERLAEKIALLTEKSEHGQLAPTRR